MRDILGDTLSTKIPGGIVLDRQTCDWYCYYLADDKYPELAIIMKPNGKRKNSKGKKITKLQESTRNILIGRRYWGEQ